MRNGNYNMKGKRILTRMSNDRRERFDKSFVYKDLVILMHYILNI